MFVEYKKMNKKQKKEYNNRKRNMWEINPITKTTKDKKKYNRNAQKKEKFIDEERNLHIFLADKYLYVLRFFLADKYVYEQLF